jgi:hypothetical protein
MVLKNEPWQQSWKMIKHLTINPAVGKARINVSQ